ncbi:beta-phosphoglucomutase family hydrolase [Arthrobacter sp. LAPM80]|uniref:beta-phosphoglucomutase family hydrolase n=1 Tax=Arthrobacter sp. LAPM80 TaxID=3141788 RepID=UPI00398AEFFF
MNTAHPETAKGREHPPVDLVAYDAWLFDLDGVLTKTASVHAAAWKQAFDAFLKDEGTRSGQVFTQFDPGTDYQRYVDGEPRADGVRNFLAARGITVPEGTDGDAADARTVHGLGKRKNELLLQALKTGGVPAYDGAIALVKVLNLLGIPTAVVSASENTAAALEAAGIADLFDARVDGHVVKECHLAGKPAPDSYLEGARLLGVDPARSVVVEDALAGVEAGRAGRFGLVIGVNHHDPAGGHSYADQLRTHGADVVVTDLAELLDSTGNPPPEHVGESAATKPDGGAGSGEMEFTATVASSVIFVTELERSVGFYREVFACTVALRHGNGALLLAPGGFQIYLVAIGNRKGHPTGGIGEHHLMWATDSAQALNHFEQLLKDRGCYTYTHTGGEVTFVEGRDPDGIRVVIAHPSPQQQPRSVLDGRLYN